MSILKKQTKTTLNCSLETNNNQANGSFSGRGFVDDVVEVEAVQLSCDFMLAVTKLKESSLLAELPPPLLY
jgi:hypothetical protein